MSNRLPKLTDILQVFAVIVVMFYGWSMVVYIWKFPGWIYFLNLGELFAVFSYQLVINLFESLTVLLILLAVCAILPAGVLRDDFAVRGSLISVTLIAAMMLFINRTVVKGEEFGKYMFVWMLGALALAIVFAWLSTRLQFIHKTVAWLSDQLTVFLYVLLPFSVVGFVVVLIRHFA